MPPEPDRAGRSSVNSERLLCPRQRLLCPRLRLSVCLISACLVVGCSGTTQPERFAARGTVTLDGVPLGLGLIRLVPISPSSGPGAMTTIVGGNFEFSEENGPVAGVHRVEIEATDHQIFEIDDEGAFAAEMAKSGKSPLSDNPVPTRYNSASQLTTTIDGGSQRSPLVFELSTDVH